MAKQPKIVTNACRQEIVARYAKRQAELERVIAGPARTDNELETRAAQ